MSQWGKNDVASNSVIWAPTSVKKAPSRAEANTLYGNTTVSAYLDNVTVGMYAVDSTEIGVGAGGVASATLTYSGSGYIANATVTISGGGGASATANATANSTGKITVVNITAAGSSYETNPTIAVAAPANTTFNANSAVTEGPGLAANSTIALTSAGFFVVNDPVTYRVAAGNTAISPLVSGTKYYIQFANSTVVALSTAVNGARIQLTKGPTETGHALQGDTATAVAVVGGAQNKGVAHTGWVLRTEGTGGRAGRVQYEVLVAGGITGDGSDDTLLPDS